MGEDKEFRRPSVSCGFSAEDIVDAVSLLNQLKDQSKPVCACLLGRSQALGDCISSYSGSKTEAEALKPKLAEGFNQVLRGDLLYSPTLFLAESLGRMTQAVLAQNPEGLDLVWLHKLLLRDAFPIQLSRKSETLAATWKVNGIEFRAYCEVRRRKVTYKVPYTGGPPWHPRSLEQAIAESKDHAKGVLDGNPAPKRKEAKARDAKAEAWDRICAVVAKVGVNGMELVVEFVANAVAAQVLLGPERPLLPSVTKAEPVMLKPTQLKRMDVAYDFYRAFTLSLPGGEKKEQKDKLSAVKKYVDASAACERKALELARQEKKKLGQNGGEGQIGAEATVEAKSVAESQSEGQSGYIYADEATTNGIQVWLNELGVGWKRWRNCRDYVVNFFTYMRDTLHCLRQGVPTQAHRVPRPKSKAQKEPVVILWPNEFWTLLLNCQDLEAVLVLAEGVLAGLHQTEIRRLDWDYDIVKKDGKIVQLQIPPGKGKETQGVREGRYVTVRSPLDEILAQVPEKLRHGRMVTNNNILKNKLEPLLKRLGIVWKPSIMRHSFASFLKGIGVSLKDVADEMGDMERTVKLLYLREIDRPTAELQWKPPFDLSDLAKLPMKRREWDKSAPLKEVSYSAQGEPTIRNRPEEKPAATDGEQLALKPNTTSWQPWRRVDWPPDEVMRVWGRHLLVKEMAILLACRDTTVSAHLKVRGICPPNSQERRKLKQGIPIDEPEIIKQARLKLLEIQARLAAPKENGTCQEQNA